MTLYTVGHSSRPRGALRDLLLSAGVRTVADVRRLPGSRRHPWFAREALERELRAAGIGYVWHGEALGGRVPERVPLAASRNRAWGDSPFRNFADAMAEPAFAEALAALEAQAREAPAAVLCAERDWRECHRRLLADALCVHGFQVVHLLEPGSSEPHTLDRRARVEEGVLCYPTLL